MTSPASSDPTSTAVTYEIDGSAVTTADDFYAEVGRAVNGPDGYFGSNLDALADCLRGGFGTPEDRRFSFVWHDSARSQAALSNETRGAHSVFDLIVEVFADSGVELQLR